MAPIVSFALRLWMPEESEVKGCEHQDNADVDHQPFPESVSEEHEIHADDQDYHRHQVKRGRYMPSH
jgi:hypothetical protein